MTTRIFTQQDFLDFESTSSGLDIFASPNNLVLAKDPTSFIQNNEVNLNNHITSQGLINSWGLEDVNPNCVINFGKSQTTDNSLAALYFFITKEEAKTKKVFQYYLSNLPATFITGTNQIPDWVSIIDSTKGETQSLSVAYLLYSVCYYQSQTKSTQFRQLALFCAQQLIDLKSNTSNLIKDSYSTISCSMESNVIAYLALKLLGPFTNNPDIISFTENLKNDISVILGLKDNTLSASFSANSVIFAGLYASSTGNKFVVNSAKSFLHNYYITEDSRVIGIGENDSYEFKETLIASILYFRLNQPSVSFSFNSALLEQFLKNQSFIATDKISSAEQMLWFLILNQILKKDFIVEELFR